MSHSLIVAYYAAFNAEDPAGMLACVSDDIEHRVNEGAVRHGRAAFAEFCGAFFDIRDGKIARITTFYNLADWIAQVSA